MGTIIVLEEWSTMTKTSGGLYVVNPGIKMMEWWCADSWAAEASISLPPLMNLAMEQDRLGLIKLNAMEWSQHWLSASKDHIETELATAPQLLVLSAQVRKYTQRSCLLLMSCIIPISSLHGF